MPEESVGSVIEQLGTRGGKMESMSNFENQVRLIYTIPSRGLIGFFNWIYDSNKGLRNYESYIQRIFTIWKHRSRWKKTRSSSSMENGSATAYSIGNLEDRGVMFIEPGTKHTKVW